MPTIQLSAFLCLIRNRQLDSVFLAFASGLNGHQQGISLLFEAVHSQDKGIV